MNVHRGEGINGHTNCRAEALLQDGGCRRHLRQCQEVKAVATTAVANNQDANSPTNNNNNNENNLGDAIQQVRQLARERPNFLREVKAQVDRDLQSRVKSMIVSKGTEEQKSKSLLRLRTNIVVPTVQWLDWMEDAASAHGYGGWKLAYGLLLVMHISIVLLVCGVTWMGLSVALWRTTTMSVTDDNSEATFSVSSHVAAILYSFHMALALLVLIVRRLVFVMHRKSRVMDQFLQEVFSLSAEEDLGISVRQFAARARLWMKRITTSSVSMLLLSFVVYRWMHRGSTMAVPDRGTAVSAMEESMTDQVVSETLTVEL